MSVEPVETLAASDPGPYGLGAEPFALPFKVDAGSRRRLSEAASGAGTLFLLIEGIEILRPGATYEVYLNPPEGRLPDPADRSYLGQLSLFGSVRETPPSDRSFDLGRWVRARRGAGAALDVFRVLIVPGDERASGPGPAGPSLRFRRISVKERRSEAP